MMHSFNFILASPIHGLDKDLNNSKLKYPLLRRKGLVLARIRSGKKLAFLILQHLSIQAGTDVCGRWDRLPLMALLALQIKCCIPSCLE
jgi:hypothetical protein